MANLKDIAATLALLGSGALVLGGCGDKKPEGATEVPGGDSAVPDADPMGDVAGEANCAAAEGEEHPAEGHCGGDAEAGGEGGEGEGSCGADKGGEGSCGADKGGG